MRKFALYASILGLLGVLFGAFGAHGVRGKISDFHYHAYRVGIEYLFFHLIPLFFLSILDKQRILNIAGLSFLSGILLFTSSNILMTTEAIHHINVHFLWPITPLGGILMAIGWGCMIIYFLKK